MIKKGEENINQMKITMQNYEKIIKKGVIDIEGLIESVDNLITNLPQIFEQLATGILNLDPILVIMALYKILPILLKIIGSAYFYTMRQTKNYI